MLHFVQQAATRSYWLPNVQAEQERRARRAALAAEARRQEPRQAQEQRRIPAFVPRIAGALGLF